MPAVRPRWARIILASAVVVVVNSFGAVVFHLLMDKPWGDAFTAGGVAVASWLMGQPVLRLIERRREGRRPSER